MNELGIRLWMAIRGAGWRDERGGNLIEYMLLVSLIAIVCLVAIVFFGDENSETLSRSADAVGGAGS